MSRAIWINVQVSNPHQPKRSFTIRAFVDNGSIDSGMPAKLLQEIGVRPMGTDLYEGWGKRRMRRKWGEAFFSVQGKQGTTRVTFEPQYEYPTIGAVTLEQLGFDIDMKNGGIKPFVRIKREPRRRAFRPLRPE